MLQNNISITILCLYSIGYQSLKKQIKREQDYLLYMDIVYPIKVVDTVSQYILFLPLQK